MLPLKSIAFISAINRNDSFRIVYYDKEDVALFVVCDIFKISRRSKLIRINKYVGDWARRRFIGAAKVKNENICK